MSDSTLDKDRLKEAYFGCSLLGFLFLAAVGVWQLAQAFAHGPFPRAAHGVIVAFAIALPGFSSGVIARTDSRLRAIDFRGQLYVTAVSIAASEIAYMVEEASIYTIAILAIALLTPHFTSAH